jgi:hypothetical protein
VRRKLSPWVFGNILLGGLPMVIDFVNESAWNLSPNDLHVVLEPDGSCGRQT